MPDQPTPHRSNRIHVFLMVMAFVTGRPAYAGGQDAPVQIELPEVYELANIILALTAYGRADPWEVRKHVPYYDEVMSYFAPVAHHPLLARVNYSRARWREYLSFRTDAVAFAFDTGGRLVRTSAFTTHNDLTPFDDALDLVEDFARVSRFRSFFAEHRAYYDAIVAAYADYYLVDEMLRFLRTNVGEASGGQHHRIVLSPLVYRMNAQRMLDDTTAGEFPTLADQLVGVAGEGGDPAARAADIHTLFTELDHAFVNPVSDRYAAALDSAFAYTRWQHDAGYASNRSTFNEYLTWALYDLFVDEVFPTQAGRVSLYWHYQNKRRGFVYSGLFGAHLRALWRARSAGERLADLYPALLRWTREAQVSLVQPVMVWPSDTITVACGASMELEVRFSEPMTAGPFSAIVQDGRTPVDTVLIDRDANDLEWSGDGRRAVFAFTMPSVAAGLLVFNWWGAATPLAGQSGVLLESPSAIRFRCQ